jgi:hypothetical protein
MPPDVTTAKLNAICWLAHNKPFNWQVRVDEVFACRGWQIFDWAMRNCVPVHENAYGWKDA